MSEPGNQDSNEKIVYTDGGCYNVANVEAKGVGSWSFVEYEPHESSVNVYTQFVDDTTNNRTEMLAVINAIKHYPPHTPIHIISDSGYVVKGYTHPSYLDRWIKTGWINSQNKPVKNQDLWQELLALSYNYPLRFTLIRGHNKDSNPTHAFWNSIVDSICSKTMHNVRSAEIQRVEYNVEDGYCMLCQQEDK
jgi:ribonuclease HI